MKALQTLWVHENTGAGGGMGPVTGGGTVATIGGELGFIVEVGEFAGNDKFVIDLRRIRSRVLAYGV
jgi:hypothetical protein